MRLRIVTPLSIVLDENIERLCAEDASGSFGILSGHAPFLTALTISIVRWHTGTSERYCAVRGGVMSVSDGTTITVATREALQGDNLATLDAEVLSRYLSDEDTERVDRAATVQLQLNAIRRMVSQLGSGADAGEFR